MRRYWTVLFAAISLLGRSTGFHARPSNTRNIKRTQVIRLPLVNEGLQNSSYKASLRIRGGSSSSSLSGISPSVGDFARPSSLILGTINAFFKCNPFVAAFLICAMKASMADAFAQFLAAKKSELSSIGKASRSAPFDSMRNLSLMVYGGIYQGCGQEFIYNHLFTILFGAKTTLRTVMAKVSFDMFFVQPLVSLPTAYIIKALVMNGSMKDAKNRYFADIRHNNLLQSCWMVWLPAQTVAFTIIPTHLRITFMASVSFFWLILFSTISAASKKETKPKRIGTIGIQQQT